MAKIVYTHDIAPQAERDSDWLKNWFATSAEDFSGFLQNNQGRFRSLDELAVGMNLLQDALFLTLDDGYASIVDTVLPLLEQYDVPCTIFITTGFIDGMIPYEQLLGHLVRQSAELTLPSIWGEYIVDFQERDQAYLTFRALHKKLKYRSVHARTRFVHQLYERNGIPLPNTPLISYLSWEQINTLAQHPLITIGSHTVTHPALQRSVWPSAYTEIFTAKRKLESKLDQAIKYFAYPYGSHNWLARILTKQAGYEFAFTTQETGVDVITAASRFQIPRYELSSILYG